MKQSYEKPQVEIISLVVEENLSDVDLDYTPSTGQGGGDFPPGVG